jgi:hypothetical protein
VSDFKGFVQLVIRRQRAITGGLGALEGEIGMNLHHRVMRLDGFLRVNLDFVVSLRAGRRRQGRASHKTNRNQECSSRLHIQCPQAPKRNSALPIDKLE